MINREFEKNLTIRNKISTKKNFGSGDHFMKFLKATWAHSLEKNVHLTTREQRNKRIVDKPTLNNLVQSIQVMSTDERISVKSEEEAATTIQAIYRGYKTRRKYKNIRKGSSHPKQVSKTVTDHKISLKIEKEGKSSLRNVKNHGGDKNTSMREINSDTEVYQTTDAESDDYYVKKIMSPAFSQATTETIKTDSNCDCTVGYIEHQSEKKPMSCESKSRKKSKTSGMIRVSKCKELMSSSQSEVIELKKKFSLCYPDSQETILVFGGIDPHADYGRQGNTGREVYKYSPIENKWEFVREMPEPRHHHSVVYLAGRVYLIGGANPQKDDDQISVALGSVWSFDPKTKNWYREPNLLMPRQNFGYAVVDEKIYVIGGQNEKGVAMRSVEVFNPLNRKWKEVQPLLTARIGPGCTVYEGHIWVAGGMTKCRKEPITKEVECYDAQRDKWFKIEPLRFGRCFSKLHVIKNRLFIIGGASLVSDKEENDSVESIGVIDFWDTKCCKWQKLTEFSTPRHDHTVTSIGDDLIILGGVTTLYVRALKSVECYCSEKNKWINGFASLPFSISGHGITRLLD